MSDQPFSAFILAAGKATRFKSSYPKVLHPLAGLPLGGYVLRAVITAGPKDVYMIIGYQGERVREAFARPNLRWVEQKEPKGTGHALMAARHELEGLTTPTIMVVVGDAPLLRAQTLADLVRTHLQSKAAATILTMRLDDPQGYGRVLRASGSRVQAIIEEQLCTAAQKKIREVSSGILCFDRLQLLRHLDKLDSNNAQNEYLLTDLVGLLYRHKQKVIAFPVKEAGEVLGVNDRKDLARAEKILRLRKAESLMAEGVTISNPETTYLDSDVQVGQDSVIEPGVSLLGETRIGAECRIRVGCVIVDSVLGDHVTVRPYSVISGSEIGSKVIVGPFGHIRDGAVLEDEARIGNFVEVKKSRIGRRSKAWHLSYLGDATLGQDVNIGAGTVTCNYDGQRKNPTTIEDQVFIGSGTMVVAPVKIGRGAYVGAGSTITEDVPPESLALGRARQIIKEDWAHQHHGDHKPTSAEFRLNERQSGSITILDLQGPLIMGPAVEEYRQRIRNLLGLGRRRVLLNLSEVAYLDSAGLGALVGALTAFRKARGELKLANIPAKVRTIMETARLDRAFDIYGDEPSAIASFHPPLNL